MPNKKDFNTVKISDKPFANSGTFNQKLFSYVHNKFEIFKTGRRRREDVWLECWAMYLGTPEAREIIKARILRHVGNVNNDWRHNLSTGKGFEQVETILAYLQQAFFPNRDWFDVIPLVPGIQEDAMTIKNFAKNKLIEAKFISHWELFLRQLCITGSSVLALPWRYETRRQKKRIRVFNNDDPENITFSVKEEIRTIFNNNDFEVLDVFDVYFDPIAISVNDSPLIRRVIRTRAELAEDIQSGFYQNITLKELEELPAYQPSDESTTNQSEVSDYLGLEDRLQGQWNDKIELYEYWGDAPVDNYIYKDVVATWSNGKILRFENNPFWYGRPFVIGTYTPIVRSIAALGVIEPALGMLHELDILTNQRLDNLELSVDTMWEKVDDGSLNDEDVYTQPGKVFNVSQPNTLRPIAAAQNFTITYDEGIVLESRIDKNAGTGNLISANAARAGERVTATEVNATRSAGGNRLSEIHKHIEQTSFLPVLDKIFRSYQQFIVEDEIVRIPGENPGDFDFVAVGQTELSQEVQFMPVGADHIANKEFEVNQRLAFLQIAAQNPQMSERINYFNFMLDLARRMGIDDVEQFIVQQEPAAPANAPTIRDTIAQTQGQTAANAVNAEFQADNGAGLLRDAFNINRG